MNYKLDTLTKVDKLVSYSREFEEDIDVRYQRYTIDAKSVLGVSSLVGTTVNVEIITEDEKVKEEFYNGLFKL